ncbi:outer membrane protein OmpA-like peptidoglycan-associated protein/opacity protein-like surface antigen [Novosphingobium sp. 1529]|uniref:OmpA family protein n=1 Tax=Novosphingobium sp. 1529 TaxID=3156424 RepID=UPI003397FDA1
MKTLIIATALATSALATTAHAQDTGPYLTVEGGVVKQERANVQGPAGYEHTDRFKAGWEAGGALGYDFGHFRLEAEGFYNRSTLREQDRPTGTPLPNGTYGSGDGLNGHTTTVAVMGNALIGLGHWGGIKAYAGGGVGYARTRLYETLPSAGYIDDHDRGFAWQALAGLTVPLGRNVDLGVRYRYFRPDGADHFTHSDGTDRKASLRSHALLATLTFNLGGRAPAAEAPAAMPPPPPLPAPPPPPPPPPPVAPPCNHGPFIVFFDWSKADISTEAASILDNAVHAYGNCGGVAITLAGYTDSSGTAHFNLGLSERRAQAIRHYLSSHAIADSLITSHAYGEADQRVPTADGVRELQNRRVEINYGPGAGY